MERIFNLKQRQDEWNEVKLALYQVWVGNSTVNLPIFCDYDFQKTFTKIKRQKTLKECQQALGL